MESAKRNLNILPVDESESDKPPPLVLESGRRADSDYSRASFLSSIRAWFKLRTGTKNDASLKETI